MLYCRKCGTKLDDDARFCRVCGAPVEITATTQAQAPYQARQNRPYLVPVAILVAILAVAFIVAAFAFVPLQDVNFNNSYSVPSVQGIDTVMLNFEADVANVNVIPADLPNDVVKLEVSARGSTGFFGSPTEPVKVALSDQAYGNTVMVTSRVSRTETWPLSFNLQVTCNLYVNQAKDLDLNVQTNVGSVTLNPVVSATFRELNLRSTTGSMEATFTDAVSLPQNVSISTTTGSVHFTWVNARVSGETSVNLLTTTGSISLNLQHSTDLAGTVSVSARTTTGSVNPIVNISGDVGVQITSRTNLGSISTTVQNFNGNKSPVTSSNYPAATNFLIDCQTTTGSVNVEATYQSQAPPMTEREQIRDAVMAYIQTNHPLTTQYTQDLTWTGGRVETGRVGAETYVYSTPRGPLGGAGWVVTINYPVVPNPVYSISANYSQSGILNPKSVVWVGTWQSGNIVETSYDSNLLPTQEQVRNDVINYLRNSHNETAQFMQNLNWTGGRVDQGLLVGSDLYTYISGGWNVTMRNPVVPNPIFNITADYKAPGTGIPYRVIWTGTWQNGIIVETNYEFAQ
jgi:hypothetical protein